MAGPDRAALERAQAFYLTAGAELVTALDGAIPGWLVSVAAQRGYALAPDDALVIDTHTTMMQELRDAYEASTGEGPAVVELDSARNPLDILRRGVGGLNDRLAEAGVAAPERDEMQQRLFPDDRYDLGPGAFIDLGEDVHHAGLRWGAAKAHLHLVRHRS